MFMHITFVGVFRWPLTRFPQVCFWFSCAWIWWLGASHLPSTISLTSWSRSLFLPAIDRCTSRWPLLYGIVSSLILAPLCIYACSSLCSRHRSCRSFLQPFFLVSHCFHKFVRNLFGGGILHHHLRNHCGCKLFFLLLLFSVLDEIIQVSIQETVVFLLLPFWFFEVGVDGKSPLRQFHILNSKVGMPLVGRCQIVDLIARD